MAYRPRKQTTRCLDGDCPQGVLAIFDSGDDFADRYTVFFSEPVTGTRFADTVISYLGMSANPFHPQGVGMHGELDAYQVMQYRSRFARHKAKWSSLPAGVQRCVKQSLAS